MGILIKLRKSKVSGHKRRLWKKQRISFVVSLRIPLNGLRLPRIEWGYVQVVGTDGSRLTVRDVYSFGGKKR